MDRFRKYNLVKSFNGVRLIQKAIPDRDLGYSMPENHVFRVQTHKSFLGITYWETLSETTDYWDARAVYYLITNLNNENIGF